ncbi:MAG: alpha/beta fold hydrolase [Hyphomonas sp.]
MFRRLVVVICVFAIVIGVGWLAMRRADISYAGLERVYTNKDSRFADLEGGETVHFRDMGPRDAPTLVMVHGFTSSMQAWDEIAPIMKNDYRVITLDLPAHGLSRCGNDDAMSIPSFVNTIDALTEALEVETFTLVGQGLGGNIAWNFGLSHPDRLDAMVLIDSTGWPKTKEEREKVPVIIRLIRNSLARPVLRGLDLSPLFRTGLEMSFTDQAMVTDDMIERYATLSRAPCHREALLRMMSQVSERNMADPVSLSAVNVPALIMHGADDRMVPVAHAYKFAEAMPNTQLKIYEGVGHLPQQEAPERILADITSFLEFALMQSESILEVEPN